MALGGPNVGFATLSIIPSLKGVESAISNDLRGPLTAASGKAGEDSGRSFTRGLSATIGAGAAQVAKAATIGIAAAGAGLIALGGFALKAGADFQQTRIAFEGILGSAGAADEFLKKLQAFAASTPFEFPELATATQRLLSLGQTGDQAIETLRTIGNAASAVGAGTPEIEGVVTAIAQIQAKGKLSAEELNQIAERLPNFSRGNFFEILAESAGKSTVEVQKLAEQGLIPASEAIPAILKALQQVPGAMGAMDRQSKTLTGVISTFRDNMRNALIEGVEPFLPAISEMITKVTPIFTAGLEGLVGGITALVGAFKDGGDGITSSGFAGAMQGVGIALRAVVDFFRENADVIGAVIGQIVGNVVDRFTVLFDFFKTGVLPALQPVFDAIRDVLPDLINLSDAANDLFLTFLKLVSAALKPILPILGQIIALIIRFVGVIARNKDVVLALVAAFLAFKAVGAIATVISTVSTAFKALQAAIFLTNLAIAANPIGAIVIALIALGAAIVVAYREFKPFRDVVDAVGRALKTAFDFVVRNWKLLGVILLAPFLPFIAIVAVIIRNWSTLVEFFRGLIDTVVEFFTDGFGARIVDLVRNTFENIRQIIQGGLDIITGIFAFFKALFTGDWAGLWDAVKQIFEGVWTVIGGIFKQALDYISFVLAAAWEGIKRGVSAAWDVIKKLISAAIDTVVGYFSNLPGKVIAFAAGLLEAGKKLGSAILDGFKAGLSSVAGFAGDVADSIVRVIKQAWNTVARTINDFVPNSLGFGPFSLDLPDNPIPTFAQGGIVPGPRGAPILAVVHGQEEVLTAAQRGRGDTTINVFGRSDDDMLRKLGIEQRRQSLLSPVPA